MTTEASTQPKARRPLVWWGLGLLIVGVLLGVVGGAMFVGSAGADVIRAFTAPIRDTPLDATIDLDEGTYVIYEQTSIGRGNGLFPSNGSGGVTIAPDTVSVLSPSGESLPVETTTFDETIDRNNSTFTGVVRFTVEDSGAHRVLVEGFGQQVIVAPSIASSFGNALAWLGAIALGALLAVIGLVLLIVGLVRGRRSAATPVLAGAPASLAPPAAVPPVAVQPTFPQASPQASPQGWYADPKGEARLRWWDGQQWTDYVS